MLKMGEMRVKVCFLRVLHIVDPYETGSIPTKQADCMCIANNACLQGKVTSILRGDSGNV